MKLSPFYAKAVPFCEASGKQLDEVTLPEAVRPTFHKRGGFSDSGFYYKGAGILYCGHLSDRILPGMLQIGENHCPYQKYQVIYPLLYGKFGIFAFRHQPVFRDYEGGCGPKEKNIVWMQLRFQYSAIEGEVEALSTPIKEHFIYRYRLRKIHGGYRDTVRLLEYVLTEGFNCPWDKNIWGDICAYGYVRDLADWFISEEDCHKLGTAYAFLNSILAVDQHLYFYLVRCLTGWECLEKAYIPFIAAFIVRKTCPDFMTGYDLEDLTSTGYQLLLEQLYNGKACCHLESECVGEEVRTLYRREIPNKVGAMKVLLKYRQRRV